MEFEIRKNERFDSLEVVFDGKPGAAVREALKARKFRWNGKSGLWYGYAENAEELAAALNSAEEQNSGAAEVPAEQNRKPAKRPALAPLWERCKTDDLPGYGTENALNSAARKAAHENGSSYDKEAAKIIRAELKKRFPEMKISVTSGGAGYLNSVDIVIKSGIYGKAEKTVNVYGDPEKRTVPGDELQAVLDYCNALHDAFDADDGDDCADYGAHHDLYGRASVAWDYVQTEPTAEQSADMEAFRAAKLQHDAEEEQRREAEFARQMAEREAEAERARVQAEIDAQTVAEIENAVIIREVPEYRQRVYSGLVGGFGKPCSLDDLNRQIKILAEDGERKEQKAVVSRAVLMPTEQIYEKFCGLFLHDFSFLSGMGGSCTDDPRVTDENFQKLNREQREAVEWILTDCVAIYCGDAMRLIIDPQGFNYARYVYLVPEGAEQSAEPREDYRQRIEAAAAGKDFYFPAPMAEQIKSLHPGENITILSVCPWTMTASVKHGTLEEATAEPYAQHKDAARIKYRTGRMYEHAEQRFYNGDAAEVVIYHGFLPDLPRDLLYTDVSDKLQRVNFAGEGVRDFIKSVIRYYAGLGFVPAVDTVQR